MTVKEFAKAVLGSVTKTMAKNALKYKGQFYTGSKWFDPDTGAP